MMAEIEEAVEYKKFCPAVFLDVSKAFDLVWHDGFTRKLKEILPDSYCAVICAFLDEHKFVVSFNLAMSRSHNICQSASKQHPPAHTLRTIHSGYPNHTKAMVAMYEYVTAVLSSHKDYARSLNSAPNCSHQCPGKDQEMKN